MSGYPIVLTSMASRRCVVVGGGAVAARKVEALLAAGARPVVVSPELDHALVELASAGRIEIMRRAYEPADLAGAWLVIAATGERAVNEAVSREAQRLGILVNVVDDPELCSFTVPAVIRRGDLAVAISTGGQSPALARHLREVLEGAVDGAYGELATLLGELRPRVQQEVARPRQPAVWARLLDGELLALLRAEGVEAARQRAIEIVESCRDVEADRGSRRPADAQG